MLWFSHFLARFHKVDAIATAKECGDQVCKLLFHANLQTTQGIKEGLVKKTQELAGALRSLPSEQRKQLCDDTKHLSERLIQQGLIEEGMSLFLVHTGDDNSVEPMPAEGVRAFSLLALAEAKKTNKPLSPSTLCKIMEWANQISSGAEEVRQAVAAHVRDFLPRYIRDLDREIRLNEKQKSADRLLFSLKKRGFAYLSEEAARSLPELLIELSRKGRADVQKIGLAGLDLLERVTYDATMTPNVCRLYVEAMDGLLTGSVFDEKRCSAARLSILAQEVIRRVETLRSEEDVAATQEVKDRMEEYILAAVPKTMCRDLRGAFEIMAQRAKKAGKTKDDLVGMRWKTDEGFAFVFKEGGKPPSIDHFRLADRHSEKSRLFGVVLKELGAEPDIKKFCERLDDFHVALSRWLAVELKP